IEPGSRVALRAGAEVAVLRDLVAALALRGRALEHVLLHVAVLAADVEVMAGERELRLLVVVERLRLERQRRVAARARPEIVVLAVLGVAALAGERRGLELEPGVALQTLRGLVLAGEDAGAEIVGEGGLLPVGGVVTG